MSVRVPPARSISNALICTIANVTAPTIYHHYDSADGLLNAAIAEAFAQFLESKKAAAQSAEPVTALREGWHDYVRFAAARPRLYAAMMSRVLDGADIPAVEQAFALLIERITAIETEGRLAPTVEAAADLMWAAANAASLLHVTARLRRTPPPSPAVLEQICEDAVRSIRSASIHRPITSTGPRNPIGGTDLTISTYGEGTLPKRVRSRLIHGVNGLDVHILEAGYERPGRPLALLLHGFPDLAYGWRHLIPILADAGYHVVAPDQRGFGLTTGWVNGYDAPLAPFSLLNMTRDALGLVSALGYRRTAMLVGHDLGSPIAAYCALARPDVFPSVVLMSAPFPGAPAFPFNTAESEASSVQPNTDNQKLAAALAALDPPRAYYQQYLSTPEANDDMWHPPQGLHAFFRAFFYVKSADWPGTSRIR